MNDDQKNQEVEAVDEEKDFFKDVLDEPEVEEEAPVVKKVEETDEQKNKRSQKNIDAEAKRKRLEAEAKDKAQKALDEKLAKEEAVAKKKDEAKEKQTETLGEQLSNFKKEMPEVDLKELDNDKSFKKYINGKLLGKQTFIELYKEYLEVKSDLSGKTKDEIQTNYQKKAQASSGSSKANAETNPASVYSEEEYNKIMARLPYMSDEESTKVMEKFDRTTKHYTK